MPDTTNEINSKYFFMQMRLIACNINIFLREVIAPRLIHDRYHHKKDRLNADNNKKK